MRKLLLVGVVFGALAVGFLATNTQASAPAVHIDEFGCSMLDENGNIAVFTTDSKQVVTVNGNMLRCQAEVTHSTGQAIIFRDFVCNTESGLTTNTQQVISASGKSTLTCKF